MVNMISAAVNNSVYAGRRTDSKHNQSQVFQQKQMLETSDIASSNKYADVQEIYEALKSNVSGREYEQGQDKNC